MKDSAAHNLLGITLKSGWKVIGKITKTANSTGAFFSVCYRVEKDGQICFLKAFDFAKFQQISEAGKQVVDVIADRQQLIDMRETCLSIVEMGTSQK